MSNKTKNWILYFGTFPPRECGIATYTKDLTNSMDKRFNPSLKSKILAINDNGSSIYNYNSKVKLQLDESDIDSYIEVAKKINQSEEIKIVSIQHEFGLYGGIWGGYIIPFLELLEKPVVVTFHCILPDPDDELKRVVKAIAKRSSAIIVMAQTGKDILNKTYNIETNKIYVIHHGAPYINPENRLDSKKQLGLENNIVLSTFGLLSQDKGQEYAIKALPEIVKRYPNLLYLIIGETHPTIRKQDGERYRNKLINLAKKLGLTKNVKFYNKYLPIQEIVKYLEATDIYLSTTPNPNQITSGTVAYAASAGRAIISTDFLYSREILSDERGILVPPKDPKAFEEAILKLLENPKYKKDMEKKIFEYSRSMMWNNVATNHLDVFKKIINISEKVGMHKFPRIKLNHLLNMTDHTGLMQHAKHSIPERNTGYTLDDNSRALIAATRHYNLHKESQIISLVITYLSFIKHCQREDGLFHNEMNYQRKFLDEVGSEDSIGRAIWATGYVIKSKLPQNIKEAAKFIFDNAIENSLKLISPRAMAFSIVGLNGYYQVYKNQDILEKINILADKLVKSYESNSEEDWKWFEEVITYSNGKLPESLFLAYDITKNKKYLDVATESLKFLSSLVLIDKKLVLIGHKGWHNRDGKRAFYDQQPVDTSSMVEVYLTAFNVTKERHYLEKAITAFNWFLGKNSINQVVYDESSGGCYDGLLPNCINLNQGAESTVAYLLARLRIEKYRRKF